MSSQLQITKQLTDSGWVVTGNIVAGGTLPVDIFAYENTGTTQLGTYYGVCSVEDIGRMQIFSGVAIPVFGNRFVRYGQVKIEVSPGADVNAVISTLTASVQALSTAFQSQQTNTQIVSIT
jgi:hypothetical protein